jgi:hypothetical protein
VAQFTRISIPLFVAMFAPAVLPAQDSSTSPPATMSYVDYPSQKLQAAVPEIHGLKPDSSQDQLDLILTKVGEVTQTLSDKLPNLLSHERVWQTSRDPLALSHSDAMQGLPHPQEFNYLLLFRQTESNMRTLDEYRTDMQDRAIEAGDENPKNPHGHGFTYTWVLFYPSHRSDSSFRYIGRQKIDGHECFVVAFAQYPDRVKFPAEVVLEGKRIAVYYQGVAWIDGSTFRIVRLRTDLLAPVPSIGLQRLTAELHFSDIRISRAGLDLCLPREVDLISQMNGQLSSEIHIYSHYRLYEAKTRIVPIAP